MTDELGPPREMERALVGSVLMHPACWDDVAWVDADAFVDETCRSVWHLIPQLLTEGIAPDALSLRQTDPTLQASELAGLTNAVPTHSNAPYYAQQVSAAFGRRHVVALRDALAELNSASADEVVAVVRDHVARIEATTGNREEGGFVVLSAVDDVDRYFLVPPLVPLSTTTLLAGAQGLGKSVTAAALAAAVTKGGSWADRDVARQGGVYVASAEDDSQEWRRRVLAAGGDPARVVLRDVEHTPLSVVNLSAWRAQIAAAQREINAQVQLLILDPVTSFLLQDMNPNDALDVRACVNAMNQLAKEFEMAVLAIHHPRKSGAAKSADAVAGSGAWTQAPRSVLMMAESPEEEGRVVLWLEKANWARKPPGMELEIHVKDDAPATIWHGETALSTSGLMSEEAPAVAAAGAWLLRLLGNGPVLRNHIETLTTEPSCEHSWASVKRAKGGMPQLVHRKHPDDRRSYWMMKGRPFP